MERFLRTELLLGEKKAALLRRSFVVIAGLGAVGSFATEALARSGIGKIRAIDFDSINESNINRQLYALDSTVGKKKVECARDRIYDINPGCIVEASDLFIGDESVEQVFSGSPDIVVDAIDSVNPKVALLARGTEMNVPLISSMGAALRTDPSRIKTGDLFALKGCPLAVHIRKRLRKRGISSHIMCVYSDECVQKHGRQKSTAGDGEHYPRGRRREVLGSLPTITGIFGLTIAHYVIDYLTREELWS
jgi:tRNA threonylcarbamoyladenosine dehydratase